MNAFHIENQTNPSVPENCTPRKPGDIFEGLPKTETGAKGREDTSYALISDLLSSPEGIALAKGFMQIEDRVVRRHIVKLVTQIGASGTSKK